MPLPLFFIGVVVVAGAVGFSVYQIRWTIKDVSEVLESTGPGGISAFSIIALAGVLIGAAFLISSLKKKA